MWPSSCVTPAGTSNELDVQNEWEENTHTHTHKLQGRSCGGKLVPCALLVEAAPECSKLPAGVDLRISRGERHGFVTSWP